MTHWVKRIVAAVGDCIRLRFTGCLVVRINFRDGAIRTAQAERVEETRTPVSL